MTRNLILIALIVGGLSSSVNARLTGTNPTGAQADEWCVGPRGAEACVDYQGDVIPTTTDDSSLGTSALEWNQTYTKTLTVGSGGINNSGNHLTTGLVIYAVTAVGTGTGGLGVYVSTIVPVTSTYETVISSGGPIVLTSTPNISTTTVVGGAIEIQNGTLLVITSTAATNSVTFQDAGTLTGSQLELGAASRAVSLYKTLTLIYNSTIHKWIETGYSNN